MENKLFVLGGCIAAVYFIIRFIEMRFILKEDKPLKSLIKDSLFVFVSVLLGGVVSEQLKYFSDVVGVKSPEVFTNTPDF